MSDIHHHGTKEMKHPSTLPDYNFSHLACTVSNFKEAIFRLHKEDNIVSPLYDDRYKIINSRPFRRLQYKTQVFTNQTGDHYRTRLTHTLEVAQTASIICYKLGLNSALSEIVALCHDLGHPPFGHAGERALNSAASRFGGFNHNFHTCKIICTLERVHHEYNGLNLTLAAIDGVIKHHGPLDINNMDEYVQMICAKYNIDPNKNASLEAQIAAIADDITYSNHDIEDGVRAGLFTIEELLHVDLIKKLYNENYKHLQKEELTGQIINQLKILMIQDVINTVSANIRHNKILNIDDVYEAGTLVTFSGQMHQTQSQIMQFLYKNFYRCPLINRQNVKINEVITRLFNTLLAHPECLGRQYYQEADQKDEQAIADSIINYIAGMTDRFALKEYQAIHQF